jgi:two-component sensor histidine kinase
MQRILIEVALQPATGGELWRLVVSDNGVDLPTNLACAKDRHILGMQLISDLGRQLQ